MEFGSRILRKDKRRRIAFENYSSSLQFYKEHPIQKITLKDFDEMAIERLKVLRSIERWNLRCRIKYSDEWMIKLYEDFLQNKYFVVTADKTNETKPDQIDASRQKDNISHFILRLVYCKTEELRRWFINHETDLFRVRFMRATSLGTDFNLFFKQNDLHFTPISEQEIASEATNLVNGTYNINNSDQLDGKLFYKVPFTEALDLVRTRKVFLKNGFAYVPNSDLVSLVAGVFRMKLSHALVITARALPQIDDDERIMTLLHNFENRYTGGDYSQKKPVDGQKITPQMITQLSTKSFPLCMRNMQENLQANNHLKHGGRMQYGLFLKAAGLSLEDAMQFWRSYFTKVMDVDKFDKQYAYNIRHNYGKEGKRTDYTPYNCLKIIMNTVSPGDVHGCPFRHFDENILKQKLIGYQVSQQGISELIELVNKKHYQIACQRYFEITHNTTLDNGINHPNQYFSESMAILYGNKTTPSKGRTSNVQTKRSVMHSSQNPSQMNDSVLSESDMDALMEDLSNLEET